VGPPRVRRRPEAPPASFSLRRVVLAPVRWATTSAAWVLRGFRSAPRPEPFDEAEQATVVRSGVVDALLGRVNVAPIRDSRLVDVKVASPDPRMAARLANALAAQHIARNQEFRFTETKGATDFLQEQLEEQRKKVEETELALQRYREKSDAGSLEDRQNIVVQRLADMNAQVTKARTDRLQKEAVYRQLQAIQASRDALDTFPAIISNSFIQQLKADLAMRQRDEAQLAEKYGPLHEKMKAAESATQAARVRLDAETQKIVQGVRNEFEAALANERSLAEALERQKDEAFALDRKGIEYGVLRREAESNRQIYESLMQRAKETGVSSQLRATNIRVVDPAEIPRGPVYPRTRTNLMLGMLAGLVAGVGLAFLFDRLDNRVKSPEEIKQRLGLPFLGLVPLVDVDKTFLARPLLNNGVPAHFVESFRRVRSNVLFASAEEGGKSLLVTSTGPGEGKTLVASNLAIALAQAGERVLLLDADMRRPRVHELMARNQVPGLSSVLVDQAKPSEAIVQTDLQNLWVLPSGPHPPNPAELLGSRRFANLLARFTNHFDWVVIDSPPVMAVTDATIVAHRTTGVVFVIGSEMTSRHAAESAVDHLHAARAVIAGAVLNRVNIERNAYYYSRYYRREYRDYYQSTES
jgi:polysaccharide biosynthesis transport protein